MQMTLNVIPIPKSAIKDFNALSATSKTDFVINLNGNGNESFDQIINI